MLLRFLIGYSFARQMKDPPIVRLIMPNRQLRSFVPDVANTSKAGCDEPAASALASFRSSASQFSGNSSCSASTNNKKSRVGDVPTWLPSTGCKPNRIVYQPLETV